MAFRNIFTTVNNNKTRYSSGIFSCVQLRLSAEPQLLKS
jgi:hypothetical protein